MASHYDVLNVLPSSSVDEIRASYRAALLSVHPDKLRQQDRNSTSGEDDDGSRYLRVQEAWSVLRDAESRASYDASRVEVGRNVVVGEEIVLEDMEEDLNETTGDSEYWYPCRCSDFFFVGARELQQLGFVGEKLCVDKQRQSMVLPCGSCSLHLRVHFWVPCS